MISKKKLNLIELSLPHFKMIIHWVPPYPILVRINKLVHGKTFVNSEVLHKCIILFVCFGGLWHLILASTSDLFVLELAFVLSYIGSTFNFLPMEVIPLDLASAQLFLGLLELNYFSDIHLTLAFNFRPMLNLQP